MSSENIWKKKFVANFRVLSRHSTRTEESHFKDPNSGCGYCLTVTQQLACLGAGSYVCCEQPRPQTYRDLTKCEYRTRFEPRPGRDCSASFILTSSIRTQKSPKNMPRPLPQHIFSSASNITIVSYYSTIIMLSVYVACRCSACHLLSCWFLAQPILRPWRWRRHAPPKRRLCLSPAFTLVSCSANSSTLKMETCSSETSDDF
jgi:hypothetical protein